MGDPSKVFDTGLNALGYQFIPGGVFNHEGNLQFPYDMTVPDSWTRTVGRVAVEPAWKDLYSTLGTLTVPGTAWSCWHIAIAFNDGTLRVIIARSITAVGGNPQTALNWSNNLWAVVLSKLTGYAGRRYAMPTGLADAISGVAGEIKSASYWEKSDTIKDEKKKRVFLENKFKVLNAADALALIANFFTHLTLSGRVQSTVVWFDPDKPSREPKELSYWKPLHQLYAAWQNRAVHCWWNSGCQIRDAKGNFTGKFSSYPFVYSLQGYRGVLFAPYAHQPWELAGAFYPDGNWIQPTITGTEEQLDWNVEMPTVSGPPGNLLVDAQEPTNDVRTTEELAAIVSDQLPAPITAAHSLPQQGGDFLCLGTLINSRFRPAGEVDLPAEVWLPTEGLIAVRDGDGSYTAIAQLPAVVLQSLAQSKAGNQEINNHR